MTRQNGLTLIEVLISAVLLFVILGLAAVIFQQSKLIQAQALKYTGFATEQDTVINRIRYAIENGTLNGEIALAENSYSWTASLVTSAAIVAGASDNLSLMSSRQVIALYDVAISGVNSPANYHFRVVKWNYSGE